MPEPVRVRALALTLGNDSPAPRPRTALSRLSEHDARSQRERGGLEKQPIQLRGRPMVRGAFAGTGAQGIMRAVAIGRQDPRRSSERRGPWTMRTANPNSFSFSWESLSRGRRICPVRLTCRGPCLSASIEAVESTDAATPYPRLGTARLLTPCRTTGDTTRHQRPASEHQCTYRTVAHTWQEASRSWGQASPHLSSGG